jgi:hypothetical protein
MANARSNLIAVDRQLLAFPKPMEMMHRAVACADREAFTECVCDVVLGKRNGSLNCLASR